MPPRRLSTTSTLLSISAPNEAWRTAWPNIVVLSTPPTVAALMNVRRCRRAVFS